MNWREAWQLESAFVLDRLLAVRWHDEKALIDFFDRRDGGKLVLLRDHETPFYIDIHSGVGVPPMGTP